MFLKGFIYGFTFTTHTPFFVEVSLKLFLVCHVVEITCLSLHVKNTCFSAHLFLASRSAASAAADVGALYTERASPPAKQKQIGF